jgi:hypothetical protein
MLGRGQTQIQNKNNLCLLDCMHQRLVNLHCITASAYQLFEYQSSQSQSTIQSQEPSLQSSLEAFWCLN